MGDITVGIIGLGGAIACLSLAYLVFRRGHAERSGAAESSPTSDVKAEAQQRSEARSREQVLESIAAPGTEFLPMDVVLAKAESLAPRTEFLPMNEILVSAQRREQAPPDPKTEILSRDDMLSIVQPRERLPSSTEFLSQDEVLAVARARERPPSTTEFMSRDAMLAVSRQREQVETPATEFLTRDEVLTGASRREPPPATQLPTPKFEPQHVPDAPPEATASSKVLGAPDIPAETLELHLHEALDAMVQLLEAVAGANPSLGDLAAGPEQLWRGNLEVLSLTGARVVEQMLLPGLRNPNTPELRRLALALTLLEIKRVDVPTLVLDLFAELDAGRTVLLDALAHWDDPRADKTILKGLERFVATHRLEWLGVCVERRCSLPVEILGPLLEEKEPELVAAGLRLVPFCASVDRYSSLVDRHLIGGIAAVREPAIITGLVLARPTALVVSKQAARDPSMPLVCQALAMTGSDTDSKSLIAWASKPSTPAYAGWALGLCGRPDALDACVSHLDHNDVAVVDSALAGFRHASAFDGPAEQARHWWTQHRADFKDGVRYVAGRPIGFEVVRERLLTSSTQARQALALELVLRSRGRMRLPARRLPRAYVEAVARLSEADLVLQF